jgi:hypothetical protein
METLWKRRATVLAVPGDGWIEQIGARRRGDVLVAAGGLVGSRGHVEQRRGFVFLWAQGLIERQTVYTDIDQARTAAERLAEERE